MHKNQNESECSQSRSNGCANFQLQGCTMQSVARWMAA